MLDEMKTKDPYEDQLSAARFKAERDVARQEIDRMRPAFEWVEEHGGLEKIRRQRRESIPRAAYERKRGNLLKHIAGCEKALGKRNKRVKELEKEAKGLRERVNRPAPKVLDVDGVEIRVGETVWLTDGRGPWSVSRTVYADRLRVICDDEKNGHLNAYPEMLTHRAPVLAADGMPLHVGDTVWEVETGDGYVVERIYSGTTEPDFPGHTVACRRPDDIVTHMFKPSQLAHQRPVLDAGGVEIREGETVYKLEDSRPYTVKRIDGDHVYINAGGSSFDIWTFPWALTHERPDSWERLEGDCAKSDVDYCAERGLLDPSCDTVEGDGSTRHCTDCGCTCGEKMARDLVRRAKALAERGQ